MPAYDYDRRKAPDRHDWRGGAGVAMTQEQKVQALAQAAGLLGRDDDFGRQVLGQLWDAAFEEGRLDALDELQDRFCVCMK